MDLDLMVRVSHATFGTMFRVNHKEVWNWNLDCVGPSGPRYGLGSYGQSLSLAAFGTRESNPNNSDLTVRVRYDG